METYKVYGVIDGPFEITVRGLSEWDAKEKAQRVILDHIRAMPGIHLPQDGLDGLDVIPLSASQVERKGEKG